MQSNQINLMPFVVEAFSTNKKIYKMIDEVYNTDKLKFMKLASDNEFYNHKMSKEGNIEQEYYFKKSLGILIKSQTDLKLNQKILNIIKKGWHYAYVYTQQHNTINLFEFFNRYIKKNKGIDNVTDDDLNSNTIMLIILADYMDKTLEHDEMFQDYIRSLVLRLQHYKEVNRMNIDYIDVVEKKRLREIELTLQNEKQITNTPLSYRIEIDMAMTIDVTKMSQDDKFFSCFSYIFDLENMSLISMVSDDYLKSKEMQELIYCYTQFRKKDEEINYDELIKFLYPAIQLRYLCREYKKSKSFFFNNLNEELYTEISKLENENKKIKKNNVLVQCENEKLKLEIQKLIKENKKLQFELDKRKDESTEINALREFVFNLDKKEDIIDDDVINMNTLKNMKIIFVGGSQTLQNKLKTMFDMWDFININTINFNTNILLNADMIIIYTNYLSHALYYKVINTVNKYKLKVNYINTNTNIENILKTITFMIN